MAETKVGIVAHWQNLSPRLAVFRLLPERSQRFPEYQAGQYIWLRRDDCKLTTKMGVGADGRQVYGPDLDASGNGKLGSVTHAYSVASAPWETEQHGWLEFFVILESGDQGENGRLTSSLFQEHGPGDSKILYQDAIQGGFTLSNTTSGFTNVLFIGTGTGVAPFASMIKQLQREAILGKPQNVRYTLIEVNHVFSELAYHDAFLKIEATQKLDFLYVPSVSRPSPHDLVDPRLGMGRANNLLRYIFQMPLKEEEDFQKQKTAGGDLSAAARALEWIVRPVLPHDVSMTELKSRFEPADRTVVLCCGNPASMADLRYTCESNNLRFEKEDW
jgi:ferredoxin-NADP reductase